MVDKAKLILCIIILFANTIYGLASPFLPTILNDLGIDEVWTGIIFATYAIAACVTSPVAGKVVDKCGHAKMLSIGSLLMAVACTSFGLAQYVAPDNTNVIIAAICLRIL